MNPALSVIFFTTLSGAGYGLLVWTAVGALLGQSARSMLVSIALALVLVTIGLLSSLAHLGQPRRAWRALSQWRTSWLSREGVMAVVTYVPALLLAVAALPAMIASDANGSALALGAATLSISFLLIACALGTVFCTAMIYASLKPIPAWRHGLVVPVYVGFALLCGGLLAMSVASFATAIPMSAVVIAAVVAIALAAAKWRYWRDIDHKPLPHTRGDAVGLPTRTVSVFERPHTEANYLTREMLFVLARKHALTLRWLAVALFAMVPVACLAVVALADGGGAWLVVAALGALAGAFIERWLFFAEARHLVALYY